MEKRFRLRCKNLDQYEGLEQIEEVLREHKDINNNVIDFTKVLEAVVNNSTVEVEGLDNFIITEEERRALLNIVKKNVCLKYEEYSGRCKLPLETPLTSVALEEYVNQWLILLDEITDFNHIYKMYSINSDKRDTRRREAQNRRSVLNELNVLDPLDDPNHSDRNVYRMDLYILEEKKSVRDTLEYISDTMDRQMYKELFVRYVRDLDRNKERCPLNFNGVDNIQSLDAIYTNDANDEEKCIDKGMRLIYEKGDILVKIFEDAKKEEKSLKAYLKKNKEKYPISEEDLSIMLSIVRVRKNILKEIYLYSSSIDMANIFWSYNPVKPKSNDLVFDEISKVEKDLLRMHRENISSLKKDYSIDSSYLIHKETEKYLESEKFDKYLKYRMYLNKMKYSGIVTDYSQLLEQVQELNPKQRRYIEDQMSRVFTFRSQQKEIKVLPLISFSALTALAVVCLLKVAYSGGLLLIL